MWLAESRIPRDKGAMVLHRQLDWGDAHWTTGQRKRKRRKARMVAVVRLIFFRPHRIASVR